MFHDFIARRALQRLEHHRDVQTDVITLRRLALVLRAMDDRGHGDEAVTTYSLTSCARSVSVIVDRLEGDDITLHQLYTRLTTDGPAATHTRPVPGVPLSEADPPSPTGALRLALNPFAGAVHAAMGMPGQPLSPLPTSNSMFIVTSAGRAAIDAPADLGPAYRCPMCDADTYQGPAGTCGYCGHVAEPSYVCPRCNGLTFGGLPESCGVCGYVKSCPCRLWAIANIHGPASPDGHHELCDGTGHRKDEASADCPCRRWAVGDYQRRPDGHHELCDGTGKHPHEGNEVPDVGEIGEVGDCLWCGKRNQLGSRGYCLTGGCEHDAGDEPWE